MKYFVISDIHAYYNAMITALNNAGYNKENPNHHLLVLGDLFDRGNQAVEVLEYLYPLTMEEKATVILGNHDSFLLDFLGGDYQKAGFNIRYNGFGKTLRQLSGKTPNDSNYEKIHNIIDNRFPDLHNWLNQFPYYLEIGDYVFVHGGIDGSKLDWRTMSSRHDFIWSREINLPNIPEKTVVAGHHRVATIRINTSNYELLFLHSPEYFDILREEGKILIDRFVEVSEEINVLVLDI